MPYQHDEGQIFGTFYHITYQNDSSIQTDILAELQKVDNALSMFNKESIISHINRGENVETNEMFESVFNLAEKISDNTDGAFDITVAPLVNAWGFGFKTGNPPTKQTVDSLRAIVGYKKVKLVNHRITKTDARVMLDCSAIAKGYGCDVVARLLEKRGIKNYMVEIGGEVVTHGISEKRLPWKIGVTKPSDDSLNVNNELQTVLNVKDRAMATSGNYRNFYYRGGKKYAHYQPCYGLSRAAQHSLGNGARKALRGSRRLCYGVHGDGHGESKEGARKASRTDGLSHLQRRQGQPAGMVFAVYGGQDSEIGGYGFLAVAIEF